MSLHETTHKTPPPSLKKKKKPAIFLLHGYQVLKDFVYQSVYYLLSYSIIYYQSKASAVAGRSCDELRALALTTEISFKVSKSENV